MFAGRHLEIWIAADDDGRSQVMDFVNASPFRSRMKGIITRTANEGQYINEEVHKHIGEGIYEFKAETLRVYSFNEQQRVVLTHAGKKPKSVVPDRTKAIQIRAYWNAR